MVIVVLMGVSGSGKTTIGLVLARKLGVEFADADDFHTEANKAKMHAGIALTDEDREPWLETLHGMLAGWFGAGKGGVLACSALKETYRTTLAAGLLEEAVRFVLLEAPKALIAARLAGRQGTFMNPALLDSQLATLETPKEGGAVCVENDRSPDEVAGEIVRKLNMGGAVESSSRAHDPF